MKQPTVGEVLRIIRELRRLGIKPRGYNLVSPWHRPFPRLSDTLGTPKGLGEDNR